MSFGDEQFGRAVFDHGYVWAEMWPTDLGKSRELWTEDQVYHQLPPGAARRAIILALARAIQIEQGARKRRGA